MKWQSASNCEADNCVQVAFSKSFVHVRASDKPERVVDFTYDEWKAFTEGAKLGEFDM